jgi:hypothetical protein
MAILILVYLIGVKCMNKRRYTYRAKVEEYDVIVFESQACEGYGDEDGGDFPDCPRLAGYFKTLKAAKKAYPKISEVYGLLESLNREDRLLAASIAKKN